MRLEPGGMRELHWHVNASYWVYRMQLNGDLEIKNKIVVDDSYS